MVYMIATIAAPIKFPFIMSGIIARFFAWVTNGIRTHTAAFTEPSANHYTIATMYFGLFA